MAANLPSHAALINQTILKLLTMPYSEFRQQARN